MYLLIGLGNPEPEYSKTRHNMGFDVINQLAQKHDIKITKKKFDSLYGTGIIEGEKVILIKPQTYMNLSGKAIVPFMNFYKVTQNNIIVIYDDIDLLPATIKVRKKGGPGTHNGMKSVISELDFQEFTRIRIGIGTPTQKSELIAHVIQPVSNNEYIELNKGISKAVNAIEEILKNGVDIAMNRYN